jgi:hypothetical protein
MREKFELACKIVGLALYVSSILVLFSGIAIFIILLDTAKTIPHSTQALMTQTQIAELRDMSSSMRNMYTFIVLFFGIIEMLLGIYLMKSNNLFIKLCYPFENKNTPVIPPSDIQLDMKAKESQQESKKPSENKYAPPGNYQK